MRKTDVLEGICDSDIGLMPDKRKLQDERGRIGVGDLKPRFIFQQAEKHIKILSKKAKVKIVITKIRLRKQICR